MREILFRGKRKDNGELVYGSLVIQNGICFIYVDNVDKGIPNYFQVISETLGQFTGLLDKNDNKIFEGDIVKFYEVLGQQGIENPLIGTVVFKAGFFEISYNNTSTWYLSHAWKIEVIGNIHDNPELLGGAK